MSQTDDTLCIAPEVLEVFRDESNNLGCRIEGLGRWTKVTVRLAFPYSNSERFVALFHENEQIAMIRDLAEVEEKSRALLREAIRKRYHIPEVLAILQVREGRNATVWTVRTEKGERKLMVRDRHNFRRVRGGDTIIIDMVGNRFRLARDRRFDPQSQRLLDLYG